MSADNMVDLRFVLVRLAVGWLEVSGLEQSRGETLLLLLHQISVN
jgi:hypothetical protein